MARGFNTIDDALPHLDANLRLLLRPHAFQHLPGVVLWFADVFDAQAIARYAAVVSKKPFFVTAVPAVDLTVQEVFDCLFVHAHITFILGWGSGVLPLLQSVLKRQKCRFHLQPQQNGRADNGAAKTAHQYR
ncbi:hypothetical protein D3C71_1694040 [compost metagenome]